MLLRGYARYSRFSVLVTDFLTDNFRFRVLETCRADLHTQSDLISGRILTTIFVQLTDFIVADLPRTWGNRLGRR
jgi:hypothetical protein